MTKRNIELERNRFNTVREFCRKNGIVPQISKLKITQELTDGSGIIDFDLKSTQLTTPGDVSLNRNDVFIPFSMGVLISMDTATPSGKSPLFSYAPRAGAQNPFGFVTTDIEALYNGELIQIVDQTTIMQSFPAESFKHIGMNEPCVLLNSEDTAVSVGIQGEYDIENMLSTVVPNIAYQGTMDIKTTLRFNGNGSNFGIAKADAPTVTVTTHKARVAFLMIGVLIKNGATMPQITELTNALGRC